MRECGSGISQIVDLCSMSLRMHSTLTHLTPKFVTRDLIFIMRGRGECAAFMSCDRRSSVAVGSTDECKNRLLQCEPNSHWTRRLKITLLKATNAASATTVLEQRTELRMVVEAIV